MSQRSLLEINHDLAAKIRAQPIAFAEALHRYLSSGGAADARALERFGLRLFGRRHHTEPFAIAWGAHIAREGERA